MVLKILKYFSQ